MKVDVPPRDDLLDFWFGPHADDATAMAQRFGVWFRASDAFDLEVRRRFSRTVESAGAGDLDHWADSPRGTLALIIALDQLPRNVYRGQARAFATDARAVAVATTGMARRFDRELALVERVFFYIPFEHAEDLVLQDRCVRLYRELDAAAPPGFRELTAQCVTAGEEHREVVRRFGRFPNRNAALGRRSSAAERAWAAGHDGWGQNTGR